ncbi:MAG: WavE lipopolysaccharide synthesis family protein [Rubripirellula sp.]
MWKWEWICWFVRLVSKDPEGRVRRFRRLVERLSREGDIDGRWWGIFREIPKQAEPSALPLVPALPATGGDTAIVMQGPVIERDDLTYETLQLYRRTMPHAKLILSTWTDTDEAIKRRIEGLGVDVVVSDPPEHPGPQNLNLQVVSTHRGITEAKAAGCEFVMKTRADMRIHVSDADQFCRNMLEQFPITGDASQRQRILVTEFATRLYLPFHLSDILMFGTTDDLLEYWTPEMCGPEVHFEPSEDFGELLDQPIPEIVLCRRYLNDQTMTSDDLNRWWRLLANRFVVVDRDMLDLFWPKYNYNVEQRVTWSSGNMALCSFLQWFQLHHQQPAPKATLEQLRRERTFAKTSLVP